MARKFSEIAAPEDYGRFIDAEERDALIAAKTALRIVGVRDDLRNMYAGKPAPRYLFDLLIVDSGERVTLGLGQNSGRDQMVEALREALVDGIEPVRLVGRESRDGNRYVTFTDADAVNAATPPDELPGERLTRATRRSTR